MKTPDVCFACKYKPTALNKLVKLKTGEYVHKSHLTDKASKYYKSS